MFDNDWKCCNSLEITFLKHRTILFTYRLFQNHIRTFKVFPPPFFPAADCVRPVLPDEMMLSNEALLKSSFPEGVSVSLACESGYNRTSGSGLVTCSGGEWTEPDLVCTSESLSRYVVHVRPAGRWGGIRDSHWTSCCFQRETAVPLQINPTWFTTWAAAPIWVQ